MACVVEIRGAGHDLLHEVVRDGLGVHRAALAEAGYGMAAHVAREFDGFLSCGDPALGFAWLQCKPCDHHRLVTFSCKCRGFCPSCGGRRMAEKAAWLVDRVLPHVETRQWVLTVPWKRRWLLARKPALANELVGVALGVVEAWYREAARAPAGRGGSVAIQQRFGSALNLNLHFHVVTLDGVYVRGPDGELHFRHVVPHTDDVERMVVEIAERCEALLADRGYGPEEDVEVADDDSLALLQQASLGGLVAVGPRARRPVRRVQTLSGRTMALPPRTASCDGYNLNAGVGLKASDREGLERLCRYILRPPLAKARVSQKEDGTVVVGLKRAWSDGTTSIELSPGELVEKLSALIPPPMANTIVYRGVLAGHAAWRSEVVPTPPQEAPRAALRPERPLSPMPTIGRTNGSWMPWGELLQRVFRVDGFRCPTCGQPMTVRCVVQGRATRTVVEGLIKATGPP